MILIGQYDSPFVRRAAIAMRLYGLPFEHRPWSVFGDADKIRRFNPLTRVPTLVLDDGDVILDSAAIIDHIDSLADAATVLMPRVEPQRRRVMNVVSLATGLADKAVSLFYEQKLHKDVSALWESRCLAQLSAAVAALEESRRAAGGPHWFGDRITHADIAAACALRHACEAHPGLIDFGALPALRAHCEALEALPVFIEISQPFIAPA